MSGNPIIGSLSSGFSTSVAGIYKAADVVAVKPAVALASVVAKVAVTDPYFMPFAGVAGAGLVFKGVYTFINSDKKIRASAELVVGLTGLGIAIFNQTMPFFKETAKDHSMSAWFFLTAIGASAGVALVGGVSTTAYICRTTICDRFLPFSNFI